MAKKKTETVVVTWRVKEALRRRLEAAAEHNEVSVNAEITRRIEESFTRAEQGSVQAQLADISKKLSALAERRNLITAELERRAERQIEERAERDQPQTPSDALAALEDALSP